MGLPNKLNNSEFTKPEERRTKNNNFIKQMGIACYEKLPVIESSSDVELKDLDVICKRAIASLLSVQIACDIEENQNYKESRSMFYNLLKKFNVEKDLLDSEKELFDNNYNKEDVINVVWTRECYWSLVWALGLIEDDEIKIPSAVCNYKKAITLVGDCKNFEEFKSKTKIRNIEEILDMLDLYYRYDWACDEKRFNKPDTNIGVLDPEVVWERRKGLEWLISDIDDWNEISLDT